MKIIDSFVQPFYMMKSFITGGGVARTLVRGMLEDHLRDASEIGNAYVTDVYVLDTSKYFETTATKNTENGIEFLTKGAKYAVLNKYAQKYFQNYNEYFVFVNKDTLLIDKIGVKLPYSEVRYLRKISSMDTQIIGAETVENKMERHDALKLAIKTLEAQMEKLKRAERNLRVVVDNNGGLTTTQRISSTKK